MTCTSGSSNACFLRHSQVATRLLRAVQSTCSWPHLPIPPDPGAQAWSSLASAALGEEAQGLG